MHDTGLQGMWWVVVGWWVEWSVMGWWSGVEWIGGEVGWGGGDVVGWSGEMVGWGNGRVECRGVERWWGGVGDGGV